MTDLQIVPVSQDMLRELRDRGKDELGNPLTVIPGGPGKPLRCCLRRSTPDDEIALISYAPVRPDAFTDHTLPYGEYGPVFVHVGTCDGYEPDGLFPPAWRKHPQVLRSYAADGRLLDGVVTQPEDDRMAIAAELLSDPDVAFVHSRTISVGCFSFEIRRAA
jgi:hypothetical protein